MCHLHPWKQSYEPPPKKAAKSDLKNDEKNGLDYPGVPNPNNPCMVYLLAFTIKNKANGGVVNIPYMDGMGLINLLKRHFQGSLNHGWISIMKTKDAPSQVRSRNGVSGFLGFEGLPLTTQIICFFGVMQGFLKEVKRWKWNKFQAICLGIPEKKTKKSQKWSKFIESGLFVRCRGCLCFRVQFWWAVLCFASFVCSKYLLRHKN